MAGLLQRLNRAFLEVLLSALYFVIFAPFALMQLFDPLGLRRTRESMLVPRATSRFDPNAARRPY